MKPTFSLTKALENPEFNINRIIECLYTPPFRFKLLAAASKIPVRMRRVADPEDAVQVAMGYCSRTIGHYKGMSSKDFMAVLLCKVGRVAVDIFRKRTRERVHGPSTLLSHGAQEANIDCNDLLINAQAIAPASFELFEDIIALGKQVRAILTEEEVLAVSKKDKTRLAVISAWLQHHTVSCVAQTHGCSVVQVRTIVTAFCRQPRISKLATPLKERLDDAGFCAQGWSSGDLPPEMDESAILVIADIRMAARILAHRDKS